MSFVTEDKNYFAPFKKHECILNNKNESFENKVESLIDVWKSIAELNLSQFDIRHVIQIMDWAKLHALNIVLTAEWNAFKATRQAKLLQEIEKAQTELLKLNSGFATRCKKLADVVKNPWEDTVLMTLMKTKDADIGPSEIEFFCVETAYVISVRLKKLCESHCEDLALNLVTAFMNCNKLSKTQNFSLNATETQMWFIFDIYIALLYKFQEKQKIVILLKELTFQEGLQLVKRFAKKRVKISKIWKNCHRVAVLATQMYLSQASVKYTDDLKSVLESYIEVYITLCNTESLMQDFTTSVRRISNLADAAGLYVFCDVIQRKAGTLLKPLVIEMYIRALTTDMNELERQKDAKEQEKVTATTSRLAEAFCNLADFLDEHVKVARECVLTAFSLEPTKTRLQNIETLARRSGYEVLDTGQEWKCKLHPPVLPSDDLAWICTECGDWMCKPQLNIPLKINMALNEALQNSVLGISESLCDDLVVCLSNPRYQILSWFLPWDDLHRLCIMYLQDPQTTKNFVTELKFVDIDYSIFKGIKREPLDELAGIERGYEQYLDQDFVSDEEASSVSGDSMSQDSRPYSLGSDGAGEGPCLPIHLSPPKSDPNTLKSLRMFRPTLKRARTGEPNENVPEKLLKGECGALNLSQPQAVPFNFKNPLKIAATKPSLSTYLNGIPNTASPVNTNQETHSKNVKVATLPPLGGQVANNVVKAIQVLLQPLKNSQLPKNQASQALKPSTPHKGTITEATKKELMLKLLSKPSLSGFKENSNHKATATSKPPDPPPPMTELKILIRNTMKINKESKTSPTITHTTSTEMETSSTHSLERLTSATNPQQNQPQSPRKPVCQQANWLPKISCPHQNLWQLHKHPTLDQPQNPIPTKENIPLDMTLNSSSHRDKPSFKTERVKKLEETIRLTQDWRPSKKEGHQSISQNLERVQPNQDQKETKSSSNTEDAQFQNLDKVLSNTAQTTPSAPVETLKSPNLDRVLARPANIHSPLLEKVLRSPVLKVVQFSSDKLTNKVPHSQENPLLTSCLDATNPSQDQLQNKTCSPMEKVPLKMPSCWEKVTPKAKIETPIVEKTNPLISPISQMLDIKVTNHLTSPVSSTSPISLTLGMEKSNPLISPILPTLEIETTNPLISPTSPTLKIEKTNPLISPISPVLEMEKTNPLISSTLEIEKTNQLISPISPDLEIEKTSPLISPISPALEMEKPNPLIFSTLETEKTNQLISPIYPTLDIEKANPLISPISPALDTIKTHPEENLELQMSQDKKEVEDLLANLSSEKIQSSLDIAETPPSPEQTLQEPQEIQLTVRIRLDQMEGKFCPKKAKTLPSLSPKLATSSFESTKSFSEHLVKDSHSPEHQPLYQEKMELPEEVVAEKLEDTVSDNGCVVDKLDLKCNNTSVSGGDVQIEESAEAGTSENSERLAYGMPKNCLGVIDDGIFSDLTDNKLEDFLFQNNNDYSSFVKDVNVTESMSDEELPKNFNLTENIRTYIKKPTKKLPVVKDCVKTPNGDVCKNVNSSNSMLDLHSNVQNPQTNCKELRVILYRLPSVNFENGRRAAPTEPTNIKKKCDRGKTPPRSVRRRKSLDKSENKTDKAPNRVQNQKLSPLQDINPRVFAKENSKSCCDDLIKPKTVVEEFMVPRVLLERIRVDKKNYARSVLANVPGLNDYQMIRPTNVNHIVNVVQVSGGRQSQTVPIQNTQTSTQVSPHIQRIGQPRVAEQKPEHTSLVTSTTTITTTTTTAKTTTSPPSTLINILSQQIIRPVTTQSNTVRRQPPLINILSQQIIRPSQTQKALANANVTTSENNEVKPAITTEQTTNTQVNNVAKNTNAAPVKITNPTTTAQGSTILQFICKSSLPKFQQAFGKTVYQNSSEISIPASTTVETTSIITDSKKDVTKTVPVNVQPIQGSVIYSRQVPVGQTISLIPPGGTTRQVFRIATSNPEQISLVKDTVIHSKMSALLAAALQARPKNSEGTQGAEEKVTLTRPTLVQNARIVKPVQLQIPPNVRTTPQTNLSSTTLEQLREFDMVYKQVKERSSSTVPPDATNGPTENQEVTPQRISVTYVNQLQKYTQLSPVVVVSTYNNLQPAASPALSVTSQGSSSPCVTPAPTPTLPKIATKSSKGKTLKNTTNNTTAKSSPIPKPQQKPQEDEHTTQRIFDILAEYAEQLRNSPDLNNKPAPRRRSNPPTNPSQNSKRKKSSSSSKKTNQSSNTVDIYAEDITGGSEDSSGGGMVQLSVTDDEQSQAATINTPESTENSSPSSSRQLILTEGAPCGNQSRNLIIADSSVGEALKMPNTAVIVPGSYIMPVSMVKGAQQIAVVSGGSKILATVPARSGQNMLLFQSFMNQNRKGAISAVKYSTLQPISGISSQSLAGVSAQPPVILPSNSVATAVALGQPLTLKKLNDDRDSNELLLTISQPKDNSKHSNDLQQPDSSTSVSSDSNDVKIEETTMQSENSNEKIYQSYQKSVITNSVATSVIATTSSTCLKGNNGNHPQNIINMNVTSGSIKVETKPNERMQSVLVTACSSNGPMLSHTTPRYRKVASTTRTNNIDLPNKEGFLHNGEKTSNNEQKTFRSSTAYYINKTKKNCTEAQKMESELQKQAAIERELRLQKSLSEECEDLGVDEPSTSDLFPEADLLFDSNHSPSYDQMSQDVIKRAPQTVESKEGVKAATNLFSDDENSSSLRTDLFEYVEYQTVETALDYQARQLMNGNATSNESGSSGGEDSTLLAKCPTMSEVTLNSPISPETYTETSLNKYKFKYSNRKRGERMKQSDFRGDVVVSSSEDTVGNTELSRIHCEDDNFKLVHVAITKTDVKDEVKCELHCDEDLDSPSGRGARRSVRKLCSCCNGSQDGNISRKRLHSSRPHTPASPHKKAFLNKKR